MGTSSISAHILSKLSMFSIFNLLYLNIPELMVKSFKDSLKCKRQFLIQNISDKFNFCFVFTFSKRVNGMLLDMPYVFWRIW